jgi:hypothetical protein
MCNNQRSKWKDGQKVGVHQCTGGQVVDDLEFDQLVSGWVGVQRHGMLVVSIGCPTRKKVR